MLKPKSRENGVAGHKPLAQCRVFVMAAILDFQQPHSAYAFPTQ